MWYIVGMDDHKDFGLFVGFKNVLLFYLASAVLTVAIVGLYNLISGFC